MGEFTAELGSYGGALTALHEFHGGVGSVLYGQPASATATWVYHVPVRGEAQLKEIIFRIYIIRTVQEVPSYLNLLPSRGIQSVPSALSTQAK